MLMGAVSIFTLVAVMGLGLVCSMMRGNPVEPGYAMLHAFASLLGSALVIFVALQGDTRLYANIAIAVVILGLGGVMVLARKKGKKAPKIVLISHAGLAVVCYAVLVYFAFNPTATLFAELQ